jgi:hypothetical protein
MPLPLGAQEPFHVTMPDQTHLTSFGHGEMRSSALKLPPAARVMVRTYLREPHALELHVPTHRARSPPVPASPADEVGRAVGAEVPVAAPVAVALAAADCAGGGTAVGTEVGAGVVAVTLAVSAPGALALDGVFSGAAHAERRAPATIVLIQLEACVFAATLSKVRQRVIFVRSFVCSRQSAQSASHQKLPSSLRRWAASSAWS